METQTFNGLLVDAQPMLMRFARKLTGNREADAVDLVQSTALRALEKRHTFTPGDNARASFRGWAAMIMRNSHTNDIRKQQTGKRASDALLHYMPATVAPAAERRLETRDMLRILDGLLPRDRMVLVDCAEHTQPELAKREGVSRNTIGVRLLRARRRLAAAMEATP